MEMFGPAKSYLCPVISTRHCLRSEERPPSGTCQVLTRQSSLALATMLSLKGFHLQNWLLVRVMIKYWSQKSFLINPIKYESKSVLKIKEIKKL